MYDTPVESPVEEEDDTSKSPSQKRKMKKQRKAERAKKVYELVLMIFLNNTLFGFFILKLCFLLGGRGEK